MNPSVELFDERRDIVIPGDAEAAIQFSVDQFIDLAKKTILQKGSFSVALSGGSTPKAIYKALSEAPESKNIDWTKVFCYFSDERSVPKDDPENNYHMAMESGLKKLPIPKENIFRMEAETDIEAHALEYEKTIIKHIPSHHFDLIMLGMGEDGHTASLFPETHGLKVQGRLVTANYVPQKKTWRMSLTFECINSAKNIAIYVLGSAKASIVKKVLEGPYQPDFYPIQHIGTSEHKALWILDNGASSLLS